MLEDYKPTKGAPVHYRGRLAGHVSRTEGNLCWLVGADAPFIWRFKDGLNAMHDWPQKDARSEAPLPGGKDWTAP